MSRHSEGPRLYLRRGRIDRRTGKTLPSRYFIRDGQIEIGTGCGPDRLREAEGQLSEYLASKHQAPSPVAAERRSDPTAVLVSDVLALYATERGPELSIDGDTLAGFIGHLDDFFAGDSLADVKRSRCKAYVKHRCAMRVVIAGRVTDRLVSDQTARRELETLSAAIGYWNGEDKLTSRPEIWLPPKSESPRDAISRSDAAALLMAAMGWRHMEEFGPWRPDELPRMRWVRLQLSSRVNRAHLRRFILIGLYTGTRSNAIKALLWSESPTQAWVDLEKGMIYRRGREEADKANKRRPVVKLPRRLRAHLARWRRLDLEREARIQKDNPDFQLNAVIHHGGDPVGSVKKGFAACVRDAGLSDEITPHWLRHTCATWLMEQGAEMWEAAAFTGMTTAVLEKHYGHHRPDHQAGALKALGGRS